MESSKKHSTDPVQTANHKLMSFGTRRAFEAVLTNEPPSQPSIWTYPTFSGFTQHFQDLSTFSGFTKLVHYFRNSFMSCQTFSEVATHVYDFNSVFMIFTTFAWRPKDVHEFPNMFRCFQTSSGVFPTMSWFSQDFSDSSKHVYCLYFPALSDSIGPHGALYRALCWALFPLRGRPYFPFVGTQRHIFLLGAPHFDVDLCGCHVDQGCRLVDFARV